MIRCMALALYILMAIASGLRGLHSELPSATEAPSAVSQAKPSQPQSAGESLSGSELSEVDNDMTSITISIGSSVFSAKLYDNDTASAFLARLPMALSMSELNGNEKYYYLSDSLPTDSQRVGSINSGDLMLYGSDCLVLFYKSFNTSYSYTKLGYIENVSGLAAALGSGNAEVVIAVID